MLISGLVPKFRIDYCLAFTPVVFVNIIAEAGCQGPGFKDFTVCISGVCGYIAANAER